MELVQLNSQTYTSSIIEEHLQTSVAPLTFLQQVETQLLKLLAKGGPDPTDYPTLDGLMQHLYHQANTGTLLPSEIESLKSLFSSEFLSETMHGYGFLKPMGYAGDYLLIDKIYTFHKTQNSRFRKWDDYFHYTLATEAVRNRKDYFKQQILSRLSKSEGILNLLDVASGPARDLHELYQQINAKTLKTTCVDLDARAIAYAQELCKLEEENITFFNKNILRFTPEEKFDVIWSAGLFDYFEEKVFVLALKKFLTWLKPGGEIIVGNFSEDNSTRGYMEIFGEWILIHRSKEELTRLSILAGAKEENIFVDQEPLGINLFLKIKG